MIIVATEEMVQEIPRMWIVFCNVCRKETQMKRHGKYQRYLIDYLDGNIRNQRITVLRYRCMECMTTHAVLPERYIPNGSYSQDIRQFVLMQYRTEEMTIGDICRMYQISVDLLYSWVKGENVIQE